MTAVLVSTIGLAGLLGIAADDPAPQPVVRVSSAGPVTQKVETCAGSQKAIGYYRRDYAASRSTMGLSLPVARVWYHDCDTVRRRASEWRLRAQIEQAVLSDWNSTVGQVVRRLDAGLAGTPMAGLGAILEAEGRRYGISPYFMAAAAGTESSFGAAGCSNNPTNVWGLAACDGRWHVPYFPTWESAVGFYARFLASRWRGHSSPYSFTGYAACDVCWGRKTSEHMGRFGAGTSTRYGATP
jgi:hypothetical protein